jgi:hypothetical protein
MGKAETKQDLYTAAMGLHASFDRRLRMLLKKSFLSEDEELEMAVLKKKKLFYKAIMEGLKEENQGSR